MAKAYTREKVRDLKALTKLRARHAEESDEDYEAALRAWLYGKLRSALPKLTLFMASLHCCVFTVLLAACKVSMVL